VRKIGRQSLLLHVGFLVCGFSTLLTAALAPWLAHRYALQNAQLGTYFFLQFIAAVFTAAISTRSPRFSLRAGFLLLSGFVLLPVSHAASLAGAILVGLGLGLISPATNAVGAYSDEPVQELMSLNFVWSIGALLVSLALFDVQRFAIGAITVISIVALGVGLLWLAIPVADLRSSKSSEPNLRAEILFAAALFLYAGAEVGISSWSKLAADAAALPALWVAILIGRFAAPILIAKRWITDRNTLFCSLSLAGVTAVSVPLTEDVRIRTALMFVCGLGLGPCFPLVVHTFSRIVSQSRQWAFLTCGVGAASVPWLMGHGSRWVALPKTYLIPAVALGMTGLLCKASMSKR